MITRSLLLAMGAAAGLTMLMVSGTYVGLRALAPELTGPSLRLLLLLALHLIAVAWCCASIGLLVAASVTRWTTAFTIGAAVVVVGYLIDFVAIGWPPARIIAWAFPFNYYPALLIIGGTAHTLRDLSILFGATAAFAAVAYWQFQRRDL